MKLCSNKSNINYENNDYPNSLKWVEFRPKYGFICCKTVNQITVLQQLAHEWIGPLITDNCEAERDLAQKPVKNDPKVSWPLIVHHGSDVRINTPKNEYNNKAYHCREERIVELNYTEVKSLGEASQDDLDA